MATTTETAKLRAALDAVNSYQLPDKYSEKPPVDGSSTSTTQEQQSEAVEVNRAGYNDERVTAKLDEQIVQRYKAARERYLKQRIHALLMKYAASFDGETFKHPTPPKIPVQRSPKAAGTPKTPPPPSLLRGVTNSERGPRSISDVVNNNMREELHRHQKEESERISQTVATTANLVTRQLQDLRSRYTSFQGQRDELARKVEELEAQQSKRPRAVSPTPDENMDIDDEGEHDGSDVDEEGMRSVQEHLVSLTSRRAELEKQLQALRTETATDYSKRDALRKEVADSLSKRARRQDGSITRTNSREEVGSKDKDEDQSVSGSEEQDGEDFQLERVVEQVNALRFRTQRTEKRLSEMEIIDSWYDRTRVAMEELSGVRVLSIDDSHHIDKRTGNISCREDDDTSHPLDTSTVEGDGKQPSHETPIKKPRQDSRRVSGIEGEDLIVTLEILNEYKVRVGLKAVLPVTTRKRRRSKGAEKLRVCSVSFLDESGSSAVISGSDGVVKARIPKMNDLVELSLNLTSSYRGAGNTFSRGGDDIRFVAKEALGRIMCVKERVEHLVRLRRKYLTKIGHDGQEVVCTLNEGITVVVHLTKDYPLLSGSVYIGQVVGIGALQGESLDRLKENVNNEFHNDVVTLMDSLSKQVQALSKIPGTPRLPLRDL